MLAHAGPLPPRSRTALRMPGLFLEDVLLEDKVLALLEQYDRGASIGGVSSPQPSSDAGCESLAHSVCVCSNVQAVRLPFNRDLRCSSRFC